MKAFLETPFEFDWNSASDRDWHYIERNFIAAYFNTYKDADVAQLAISGAILQKAKEIWEGAYTQACQHNFELLERNIFNPLAPLLSHLYTKLTPNKHALIVEKQTLHTHFNTQRNSDITSIKEYLIKLTALRLYFKEEFETEKIKIREQTWNTHQRIHYLIARYQDQPIAFFSCELNYKSGRIYLRWVTISPIFQRKGLGKMMLEEVNKHFPDNTGMELYTRLANHSSRNFYSKVGFSDTTDFDFTEPDLTDPLKIQSGYFARFTRKWLSQSKTCCAPMDESVSQTQDFVGFIKKR